VGARRTSRRPKTADAGSPDPPNPYIKGVAALHVMKVTKNGFGRHDIEWSGECWAHRCLRRASQPPKNLLVTEGRTHHLLLCPSLSVAGSTQRHGRRGRTSAKLDHFPRNIFRRHNVVLLVGRFNRPLVVATSSI